MRKLDELSFTSEKTGILINPWSSIYIKLIIIGIFSIVIVASINLQVVHGATYKVAANLNRLRTRQVIADRGIISDSQGTPLVYNIPAYKLYLDNQYVNSPDVEKYLKAVMPIIKDDLPTLERNLQDAQKDHQSVLLDPSVSKDQMLTISNDPALKNIFTFVQYTERDYVGGDFLSQLLGYTGEPSAEDMQKNGSLVIGDSIGKDGLEYTYDKYLHGKDGTNILEVDTLNQVISKYSEQPPIAGDNIKLNISLPVEKELAQVLSDGMKSDSTATGAVGIVEDVSTGNILGMVSLPTYNNNDFENGISLSEYQSLLSNPNDPLLNRAIQEAQPPGSVMKTITAPAALQEGAITPSTTFDSNGTFTYQGIEFQDFDKRVYGVLNVIGALKFSSNIFFFNTMLHLGIDKFMKYEKIFGLGQQTGIDLPGEARGTMASPEVKQALTGQVWYPGDSLNAAIGQGYTTVTPIQMVNWISAIANGGTILTPHIVNEVIAPNGNIVLKNNTTPQRSLSINKANLDVVRQGMYVTVNSGIDHSAFTPVVDVAGKTGTAEFGTKKDANGYLLSHAWFAGFAPYQKPKIALVVFLEGGGLSTNAATIAKNFMTWYFGTYDPQDAVK